MHPLAARLPDTGTETWCGLHGSATALAISTAAKASDTVTLVLVRNNRQANLLEQDLKLFLEDDVPLLHFPDWETLPYDLYSPHPDIVSQRLSTLARLPRLEHGIVLLPVSTLMQRVAPLDYILGRSFTLHTGQRIKLENFRKTLVKSGYSATDQVVQAGQFAVRGALLDLFAMGSQLPWRIELFDDEIESIRTFDTDSQRSVEKTDSVRMLPGREYPFDETAVQQFRRTFRLKFEIDTRRCPLYQDLRQGIHPQGMEYYLPLFFTQTSNILEYLNTQPALIYQDGVADAAHQFLEQVALRYEQRRHDIERPVLAPAELYFSWQELQPALDPRPKAILAADDTAKSQHCTRQFQTRAAPELPLHEKAAEPASALKQYQQDKPRKILIAADSPGRREVLLDTLRTFGLAPKILDNWSEFLGENEQLGLAVLPLDTGFSVSAEPALTVLTESQLFGGRVRQRAPGRLRERDPESVIRNLTDLHPGAPVVHEDHGVGRYEGLQVLDLDDLKQEFLCLQYAGNDRLYVPVSALHLISRYTGSSPDTAPLHHLGGEQWKKVKQRAARRARDVAAELLDLYARRQSRKGFSYPLDEQLYTEFASTFDFEETLDQQVSIDAVLADLKSDLPMDRVICGDVGFGKTEVAMRAAFVAVQAGRQVALLVPTTLLAQQHFTSFSDRFADWPVRVEVLSRFRSGKQTSAILDGLAAGSIDIIIGTHRLIQPDIRFNNLGLVIIDEEQRFGVRQKERLKALRTQADVVTLTATPIPRTLNMALSGLRELSIIATPPARRMAVKTFITQWENAVIREALQREVQRGGQVYFLHNEVKTIESTAREVQRLMPGARVRIAHGQMQGRELEAVMRDFYRRQFNVLVCTTIIESGIDVPSANTILINRADKFGLAQLHQLRGRVGRSHHRAYAYLIIPDRRSISRDAVKRLEAIESMEELGAGFTLATHDMEIRGTGELLGDEQSGQIQQIGFSMYMDLLNRSILSLKSGREPDLDAPLNAGSEIDLQLSALIPDDYLPNVHTRLTLYKRIAGATDAAFLRELQVEMIDRFGLLPDALKNLFSITGIRLQAVQMGIRRIVLGEQGGRIEFSEKPAIDPAQIIRLVQSEPGRYQLDGPEKLRIAESLPTPPQRIQFVKRLLHRFGLPATGNSVNSAP